MVTKNESKDEENNTKDNSDTSNDVNEMFNFLEKISFGQNFWKIHKPEQWENHQSRHWKQERQYVP